MANRIEKFNNLISRVQSQKRTALAGASKSARRKIENTYGRKLTKLRNEYHRFERMMEVPDSKVRLNLNNERLTLQPFLPSVLDRTLIGYKNWQNDGELIVKYPGWDYLESIAKIYHRIMQSRGKGKSVEDRTPRQQECVEEIISRAEPFFRKVARDLLFGKRDPKTGERLPVQIFGNNVNLRGFNYSLDDAAQDAAEGCFKAFHTYRPNIRISSWLYGIAGGSIVRALEENAGVICVPSGIHVEGRRKLREAGFDLGKFVVLMRDSSRMFRQDSKLAAVYCALTGDYDDITGYGRVFSDDWLIEEGKGDETFPIDDISGESPQLEYVVSHDEKGNFAGYEVVVPSVGFDDDGCIVDRTSPEDYTAAAELGRDTRRILSTLTPREEKVLRKRFGIGERTDNTLDETGDFFDATRERIRQIEAKALRKLRHPSQARQMMHHYF